MTQPVARVRRLDASPKADRQFRSGSLAKRDEILLAQNLVAVARLKHELYCSRRRGEPKHTAPL
jgi:hypothetical protein